MENFIFCAMRSVYLIKWNSLDGQIVDARLKKMFLRIQRKGNTLFPLLIYLIQPFTTHFLVV